MATRGSRLLLLASLNGDVKFPGGGVEPGEDLVTALARELGEECGARLVEAGEPVLVIHEHRRDRFDRSGVFAMTSYYLPVVLVEHVLPARLSPSEADLGLSPVWLTREEAQSANEQALLAGADAPWTTRESLALRLLPTGA